MKISNTNTFLKTNTIKRESGIMVFYKEVHYLICYS